MPSSNKQFYREPPKTSNIRDILNDFYPQDIEEAIDAISFDFQESSTERITLEEIEEAIQELRNGRW